jgi:hypothetical protein
MWCRSRGDWSSILRCVSIVGVGCVQCSAVQCRAQCVWEQRVVLRAGALSWKGLGLLVMVIWVRARLLSSRRIVEVYVCGGWLAWWIASWIKDDLQPFVLMMLPAHRIARVHVRGALRASFSVPAGKVGRGVQGLFL